ncbi:MAG TPA: hypothetical protein VL201_01715 [Patescibacteria group bacterium]|jgi:hypothetical protein|nr:hypothetical protein [Patescibacteria group bacterium]
MFYRKIILTLTIVSSLHSSERNYSKKLTEKDILFLKKAVNEDNFNLLRTKHSELGLKKLLHCAQAKDMTKECWHHIIRDYHLYEDPEHNLLKAKVDILMDDERCIAYYADPKNGMSLPKKYLPKFRQGFSTRKALENFVFLQGYSPNEYVSPMVSYNEKYFSAEAKLLASSSLYKSDFLKSLRNDFSSYKALKEEVIDVYKTLKLASTSE